MTSINNVSNGKEQILFVFSTPRHPAMVAPLSVSLVNGLKTTSFDDSRIIDSVSHDPL